MSNGRRDAVWSSWEQVINQSNQIKSGSTGPEETG